MGSKLEGQVALVTGGGTGIGRQIALALGRAGARVAVAGRRPEPLTGVVGELASLDVQGLAVPTDVRDPGSVQALIDQVQKKLGPVDILVNNAAVFARGEVVALDPATWNDVLATNLTGTFLVTRGVLPGMIERHQGSIVLLSSTSGKRGDPGGAAYSASKFGIMGLAHSLLYEVRRHQIRVVVVSPSGIDTGSKPGDPEQVKGVRPHASDVAQTVLHCLTLPPRVLVREVEIWGTNP